jgi:hypothetical protein
MNWIESETAKAKGTSGALSYIEKTMYEYNK